MISVPDTDDAPDEDERESISSTTSERRTSIVLDGNTLAFENPVSLVLAAARQLGLSLRNQSHTRLLWIADEALLDEYDEDQTAEMASIPAKPLSDDVAAYYSDVFAQRSKSTVAPVLDEKQAAVIADIAAHKERAPFAATSHEDGIGADGIRRVQAKQSPALSRRSSGKGKDGGARFAVGDRVEVDFDDEGWFAGVIESVSGSLYQVKLDVGETADDVEGSEIRGEKEKADSGSGSRDVSTRADSLRGFEFDPQGELGSECGSERAEHVEEPMPQMTCSVSSEGGVEWSLIKDDEFFWSPPTVSALKAHDSKQPRWEEVKVAAPIVPPVNAGA